MANGIEWKTSDLPGTSVLKQLHFAAHADELPEAERQSLKEYEHPTRLTELAAHIDKHETILKVFLEALPHQELLDYIKDTMSRRGHLFSEPSYMGALLENFWPHEMAVTDACLTNADFVRIHRHFYL